MMIINMVALAKKSTWTLEMEGPRRITHIW